MWPDSPSHGGACRSKAFCWLSGQLWACCGLIWLQCRAGRYWKPPQVPVQLPGSFICPFFGLERASINLLALQCSRLPVKSSSECVKRIFAGLPLETRAGLSTVSAWDSLTIWAAAATRSKAHLKVHLDSPAITMASVAPHWPAVLARQASRQAIFSCWPASLLRSATLRKRYARFPGPTKALLRP